MSEREIFVTTYTKEEGRKEYTHSEWIADEDRALVTYHRLSGPAIEFNNNSLKYYYIDGRLHNTHGPAKVINDVERDWYLDGEEVSRYEHARLVQEVKNMPLVLRLVDPRKWVREYKEEIINV